VVQEYVEEQLEVAGRRSYLRLWLVVTSAAPLRAYLYKGGVIIFGKPPRAGAGAGGGPARQNASSPWAGAGAGAAGLQDHIVNLWLQDRSKSKLWSWQQLAQHLDSGGAPGRSAGVWARIAAAVNLALGAAAGDMRAEAARLGGPPSGPFEILGLDFVLDSRLRPWLLEVNSVPSMKRQHSRLVPEGGQQQQQQAPSSVFDTQKEAFLADLLALLGMPLGAAKPPSWQVRGLQQLLEGGTGAGQPPLCSREQEQERQQEQEPQQARRLAASGAPLCLVCLARLDLQQLLQLELELQHEGSFDPVVDLTAAHHLSARAASEPQQHLMGAAAVEERGAGSRRWAADLLGRLSGSRGPRVGGSVEEQPWGGAGGDKLQPRTINATVAGSRRVQVARGDLLAGAWLRHRQAGAAAVQGCRAEGGQERECVARLAAKVVQECM
jgi:hypothetical protein